MKRLDAHYIGFKERLFSCKIYLIKEQICCTFLVLWEVSITVSESFYLQPFWAGLLGGKGNVAGGQQGCKESWDVTITSNR